MPKVVVVANLGARNDARVVREAIVDVLEKNETYSTCRDKEVILLKQKYGRYSPYYGPYKKEVWDPSIDRIRRKTGIDPQLFEIGSMDLLDPRLSWDLMSRLLAERFVRYVLNRQERMYVVYVVQGMPRAASLTLQKFSSVFNKFAGISMTCYYNLRKEYTLYFDKFQLILDLKSALVSAYQNGTQVRFEDLPDEIRKQAEGLRKELEEVSAKLKIFRPFEWGDRRGEIIPWEAEYVPKSRESKIKIKIPRFWEVLMMLVSDTTIENTEGILPYLFVEDPSKLIKKNKLVKSFDMDEILRTIWTAENGPLGEMADELKKVFGRNDHAKFRRFTRSVRRAGLGEIESRLFQIGEEGRLVWNRVGLPLAYTLKIVIERNGGLEEFLDKLRKVVMHFH
mgnify:CR=1 FL=1